MKQIVVFIALVLFFLFGEIALTFSDKGYPTLLNDEEVPFSLLLDNQYSDFDGTQSIDKQVESFIKRWKIQGASMAVTKDERLVYAKGFGIANSETGEEVKPGTWSRSALAEAVPRFSASLASSNSLDSSCSCASTRLPV